ncbi:MAG: DUF4007 family protein [Phycisphaera sp.]|nr:DUF4007 family protein [Phycisphaera sp.]
MLMPIAPDHIASPTFSGHESFTLRYGWLTKAIQAVAADSDAFARSDAMVELGVGKNMVRSIRHWALVTGAVQAAEGSARRSSLECTEFGKLLLGDQGLDPFLEDLGSLWLLHWHLASRPNGPTTWYWAFNELQDLEFTKTTLLAGIDDLVGRGGWKRPSPNTLKRDVDCFIRTYVPGRITSSPRQVIEETLDSPLAELGLIGEVDASGVYAFNRGTHRTLPMHVVAYALVDFWDRVAPHRDTLAFEHITYQAGSPGRVFKLGETAISEYLDAIESATQGAIAFDSTAGLRQLYRREQISPIEVIKSFSATSSK